MRVLPDQHGYILGIKGLLARHTITSILKELLGAVLMELHGAVLARDARNHNLLTKSAIRNELTAVDLNQILRQLENCTSVETQLIFGVHGQPAIFYKLINNAINFFIAAF